MSIMSIVFLALGVLVGNALARFSDRWDGR